MQHLLGSLVPSLLLLILVSTLTVLILRTRDNTVISINWPRLKPQHTYNQMKACLYRKAFSRICLSLQLLFVLLFYLRVRDFSDCSLGSF